MQTKRIIAITTITTIAAAGLANAQTPNITDAQKSIFQQAKTLLEQNNLKPGFGKMKHGRQGHKQNKQEMQDAIATGDYNKFVQLASSTPMSKINQTTFNSLTPHFAALKNAKTNIESILKSAGVERPEHKNLK